MDFNNINTDPNALTHSHLNSWNITLECNHFIYLYYILYIL